MGIVSPKLIFEKALKGKYAIGAFNAYNMESVQAIVEAARESKSPLILQFSQSSFKYMGSLYVKGLVEAAIKENKIDLILHLDHAENYEICKEAIDLGFTSVMIDGSMLPVKENIKLTKKVIKYAHSKNVWVEAELGKIGGVEDNISVSKKEEIFTNPIEAKYFVNETGCDSLAVAVGTSHGAYKFSSGLKPKIYFKRLLEIQKQLPNTPLVLHGSSNVPLQAVRICNKYGGKIKKAVGMPDRMITKAVKTNICKVNIDTDLRLVTTAAIRRELATNQNNFDPRKYLSSAKEEMKKLLKKKFKTLGCLGKA